MSLLIGSPVAGVLSQVPTWHLVHVCVFVRACVRACVCAHSVFLTSLVTQIPISCRVVGELQPWFGGLRCRGSYLGLLRFFLTVRGDLGGQFFNFPLKCFTISWLGGFVVVETFFSTPMFVMHA